MIETVGPAQAKLLVLGEPYDPDETEPFSSPAGVLFMQLLQESGTNPDRVAFGYVDPGSTSRNTVLMALEGLGARYLVLSGSRALQTLRNDLSTREAHGHPFLVEDDLMSFDDAHLAMAVVNHWAAARTPRWNRCIVEDLTRLRDLARGYSGDWFEDSNTCVVCRGEYATIDDMGLVFCVEHMDRGCAGPPDGERLLRGFVVEVSAGETD